MGIRFVKKTQRRSNGRNRRAVATCASLRRVWAVCGRTEVASDHRACSFRRECSQWLVFARAQALLGVLCREYVGKDWKMKGNDDPHAGMAVLAVLAASAREAEELLEYENDLDRSVIEEAKRRLQQFMNAARHAKR